MRFLLDTHTFLWWIDNDPKLSATANTIITDINNEIFFSVVSGWELAIKAQIGKLTLPNNLQQFIAEELNQNYFTVLPITLAHTLQIYSLPLHHRDPFDRMLIAQSQLEKMILLTVDTLITQYEVETIW